MKTQMLSILIRSLTFVSWQTLTWCTFDFLHWGLVVQIKTETLRSNHIIWWESTSMAPEASCHIIFKPNRRSLYYITYSKKRVLLITFTHLLHKTQRVAIERKKTASSRHSIVRTDCISWQVSLPGNAPPARKVSHPWNTSLSWEYYQH